MGKLLMDIDAFEEEGEETAYDASDYATASAYEQLMREEHVGQAMELHDNYGHTMGDIAQMDPMEILMLIEERSQR